MSASDKRRRISRYNTAASVIVSAIARAWVSSRVLHRRLIAAGRHSYTGSVGWRGRKDDQGQHRVRYGGTVPPATGSLSRSKYRRTEAPTTSPCSMVARYVMRDLVVSLNRRGLLYCVPSWQLLSANAPTLPLLQVREEKERLQNKTRFHRRPLVLSK